MKFLLLYIVLISTFLISDLQAQIPDARGYIVKPGDPCPDFSLEFTDGSTTSLSELKGDVIMLQFTASWCSVCRKEMPHIEKEIWQVYKDLGLVVIGVDRDEPLETVIKFAEAMKITYPLALDPKAEIFSKFAAKESGVTRNVIVDPSGKIVFLTRLFEKDEFNRMIHVIHEELVKQLKNKWAMLIEKRQRIEQEKRQLTRKNDELRSQNMNKNQREILNATQSRLNEINIELKHFDKLEKSFREHEKSLLAVKPNISPSAKVPKTDGLQ